MTGARGRPEDAGAGAAGALGALGWPAGRTGTALLAGAAARLDAAGVAEPMGDARRLLAHALGLPPGRLTLHLGDPVPPSALARFEAALCARSQRQPVAQIIGRRAFWGHEFIVTPDVLDPRPETEALVASLLGAVDGGRAPARLLDLGTGSGCLLLTLLRLWPGATGIGTDISDAALGVALRNAMELELADRAEFRHGDWATGIAGQFDVIVSNPPYIGASEIAALEPEVRAWEPRGALTPGADALAAYRRLLPQAAARRKPGGVVAVECAPWQGGAVAGIGAAAGLANGRFVREPAGRLRGVIFAPATAPGKTRSG